MNLIVNRNKGSIGTHIARVYSLGKLYSISESALLVRALIASASFALDDFFTRFEEKYNRIQRRCTNLAYDFGKVLKEIKINARNISIVNMQDIRNLFETVYGFPILPQIEASYRIVRAQALPESRDESEAIAQSFIENLKLLGRDISRFTDQLSEEYKDWREFQTLGVSFAQLGLAVISVGVSIIALLVAVFALLHVG